MRKTALITGITGQDGSYMADLLLSKGYDVHGLIRRSSLSNTQRIEHLIGRKDFTLHYGDMAEMGSIVRVIKETEPDEIYNLAAQSDVKASFDIPEYTADINGLGPLRILDAIKILKRENKTRFCQASSSELFGKAKQIPQSASTPFYPRSPYGAAKLFAYWITINYREAYGVHASNGIMFNHESMHRGDCFVTRKITQAAAKIHLGQQECLYLGNLNAKRDWGHASEYVEGLWRITQQDTPDDYILATGKSCSVREFTEMAFKELNIPIEWSGTGLDEIGRNTRNGQIVVRIDPAHFRPAEVDWLQGDASVANDRLGWQPKITLKDMIKEMVTKGLERTKRSA